MMPTGPIPIRQREPSFSSIYTGKRHPPVCARGALKTLRTPTAKSRLPHFLGPDVHRTMRGFISIRFTLATSRRTLAACWPHRVVLNDQLSFGARFSMES